MTSYFYFHIIAIFYPDRWVWNFYRKKVLIMPKKKKKTMAVHEMAELLGLKKTDSYWLIHKQKFQTITVNGKTRVVIESFEKWYANQVKYKKAGGPPPGEELRRNTYSPQEIAELLGIKQNLRCLKNPAEQRSCLVCFLLLPRVWLADQHS